MLRVVRLLETIRCGAACTEEELHRQVADALAGGGLILCAAVWALRSRKAGRTEHG